MNPQWMRTAARLNFTDTAQYLARLRQVEIEFANSDMPPKVKALRTNSLKVAREQRQAALFCYGMSKRIGTRVDFATKEDQDYDFIARWVVGDTHHYATVQLKEVVPSATNAHASLETVVAGLAKYTDSPGLTVAIYLNQACRFDPALFPVPELKIGSLWVFGGTVPDQSCWTLWGNFMEPEPYGNEYFYPVA